MSENLTQDHVSTEPAADAEEAGTVHHPTSAQVSEPDDRSIDDDRDTDDGDTDDGDTDDDGDADGSGFDDVSDVDDVDDVSDVDDMPSGGVPAARAPSNRRGQLEREGEVAADFLETLLDICDLDGDIDVDIDGDRAAVSVVDSEDGRVPRRLVGQNGQVLDALQELTRLAVQSATGERSRLMLDVAGHRAERRATLVTLAKEVIDEVRRTGERKPLSPMTAFERKVVHDEVLAAGLVSESEGAEPRRFVVILPA